MKRGCCPASLTTPWKPARCAIRWTRRKDRQLRGWRWLARRRGNRVRTPRCCCRSWNHPQQRPCNAVRKIRVNLACDVTMRVTSTATSARRRRTKVPDTVRITRAPSTHCSNPCPNDKNSERNILAWCQLATRWNANYPDAEWWRVMISPDDRYPKTSKQTKLNSHITLISICLDNWFTSLFIRQFYPDNRRLTVSRTFRHNEASMKINPQRIL